MLQKLLICFLSFGSGRAVFAQNALPPGSADSLPACFVIQKNGLYGLGASGKWHSHSPVGDSIFHLGDTHFAVHAKSRYHLYNARLEVVAGNIRSIRQFGDHAILNDDAGWKIFSPAKGTFSAAFDSIRVVAPYALIYSRQKQGLLHERWPLEELVPPKYDKAGPYYNGVLLIDHNKLGWKGEADIPLEFDHIYKERPDVMAAVNARGTVYFSLITGSRLLTEPRDSVVFYDRHYKRVHGKHQAIYSLADHSLLGEISGYNIHPYSFDNFRQGSPYCVVARDSSCALFKQGKILTGFDYDNVLPNSQISPPLFRIIQNHAVGVVNESGEVQLKALYGDVCGRLRNLYIVRKGGAQGLVAKGDTMLLPITYATIRFIDSTYAYISRDGRLFGLYNCLTRREVVPCLYNDIHADTLFIIAEKNFNNDVYFRETLVFQGLRDVMSNANTVKGYKEGRIWMGYVRHGSWETYDYGIPSYKPRAEEQKQSQIHPTILSDVQDLYDYAAGKWGVYSLSRQSWIHAPLAHSGDIYSGRRLLGFSCDSSLAWQGIRFHAGKAVSHMHSAWEQHSRFNWVDVHDYSYSSNDGFDTRLHAAPLLYSAPGKGKFASYYKNRSINAAFHGYASKSIIAENGQLSIGRKGDIGLSDYFAQIMTNGCTHPASISDYERLCDAGSYLRISGATEHVLHSVNRHEKHISVHRDFDWVNKDELKPLIFRQQHKYGLLSDSGTYLLRPEFEHIQPIRSGGRLLHLISVPAASFRVYDPAMAAFSSIIPRLIDAKGRLLLVQVDSLRQAVLTTRLDTLALDSNRITLLGGEDFVISDSLRSSVYRGTGLLLTHRGESTERINAGHFMIRRYHRYYVINTRGDTLAGSPLPFNYIDLGDNYLLDDGRSKKVFGKDDRLLLEFDNARYQLEKNGVLIVREKEMTTVVCGNKPPLRLHGKLSEATGSFLILHAGKNKKVVDLSGEVLLPKVKQARAVAGPYLTCQQGKKYYLVNAETGQKIQVKSMRADLEKEGIVYEDAGKNEQVLPVASANDTLVVEQNGKYGLTAGGKTILPNTYFNIQKIAGVFLVQDQLEYRLYDASVRRLLSPYAYSAVYPYRDYFLVVRNGVISYIRNREN